MYNIVNFIIVRYSSIKQYFIEINEWEVIC